MAQTLVKLGELRRGQCAVIASVSASEKDQSSGGRRLLEMGFLEGS